MYRGNLSLRTVLTYIFSFENFRIFEFVQILVGFNRIKSIVILLKDCNQYPWQNKKKIDEVVTAYII